MNTFQLSCYLAVANTLSFARAAQQMNISQPAITHQIKTLETELNVKLFRRSTRMVELTPEGQAFLSDAQSMVAIAQSAKLRFGNPEEKRIQAMTIGCSSYHQLVMLAPSLKQLKNIYPRFHPRLQVVPHEQLYKQLDNGTVDMVFDIQNGAEFKEKLTFREIRKSNIVCVCAQDHPFAEKEFVTAEELSGEALILSNPFHLIPEVAKLQWQLAEGRSPETVYFNESAEAATVLAVSGFGVAILPDFMVLSAKEIAKVPFENAPVLSFGVFYKPFPGDEMLRQFIRILKTSMNSEGLGE